QASFVPETGGIYKVVALGVDGAGNRVQSSTYLWVSGSEYINWRQENNDRLELVADKKEYRVGDVATILIPHPYSGTVRALVTQERGHIYQTEVLTLPTNSEQIQIPITADMLPNMFVSVVVLHPSTPDDPVPSFKVGYAQLPIDVSEKEINITLKADRDSYLPGDTVQYDITATDAHGNPVEAEFSLAVVDKTILTLAPDNSDSLLDRFWRERGLGVSTALGLTLSAERLNATVASEAKGGGGGGFEQAFETVRGEFKDTAFWLADFTTDADGHGSVSVKLPDNLTTWVLTARGISKDTLVGDDSIEIVSTKPVLVRPVAPRFFVVGDEAQLKMIVQNNTKKSLTVDTLFDATGAELMDAPASGTLTIGAGDTATVVYPVKIGLADEAVLRFGAKGGGYEDAVEITLPVYRHSTPETVGTAGVLNADGARLEGVALPQKFDPTQGQLTVTIEPSLAAGMRDGLTYLEHYPYECTEQVVSRFLPNVVTYRAYQKLGMDNPELAEKLPQLVSVGLQKLYARQNADGGWGWWHGEKSNPNITAYVLLGMSEAQKADFAVEKAVIQRGAKFLLNHLASPKDVESNWAANRQAFILYVLAETGNGDLGRTVAMFDQREKLDTFGKAYLAMAFRLLEPKNPDRAETLISDITGEAIVSATGAHW
ncbi:MAG TPA: alpha-2-macroglobulin, partial [Anaerolineae bacterium]|nr:alpha-2-macroglobulin [Anaerolineae bacterium]